MDGSHERLHASNGRLPTRCRPRRLPRMWASRRRGSRICSLGTSVPRRYALHTCARSARGRSSNARSGS